MGRRGIGGRRRALVFALIGLAYLGAQWVREGQVRIGDLVVWPAERAMVDRKESALQRESPGRVEELFEQQRSDVVVEVAGTVDRVLSDDNEGSRHQRFILRLGSGHTVLVAHNIDLARRVPLRRGEGVEVKGEYEWNDHGGVLHWTHRDPRRRHEGGWIRHRGETYE